MTAEILGAMAVGIVFGALGMWMLKPTPSRLLRIARSKALLLSQENERLRYEGESKDRVIASLMEAVECHQWSAVARRTAHEISTNTMRELVKMGE